MIAHVVPAIRLRRDTTWWSYRVPSRMQVSVGSLVTVPFRGIARPGVVWALEDTDSKATESILSVLTSKPLVKAPHRSLIEFLSQEGLCSLSTALHLWLPPGLRELPYTGAAKVLLAAYDTHTSPSKEVSQHCILAPGMRPLFSSQLAEKFGTKFRNLFTTNSESLSDWFAIAQGDITVGLGRERALFAPWANLRQVTALEPEDISYYHEQTPYLNLVEAAFHIAHTSKLQTRSFVPDSIAKELWGAHAQGTAFIFKELELVDLTRIPLLSPDLVSRIRTTITNGKRALLILNAHDRLTPSRERPLEKTVLPGIETLRKRLAHLLGMETLSDAVILGTRSVLADRYENVGLVGMLSIDPLLDASSFANIIHGVSDLGHLASYKVPCIVQTHRTEHPLAQAILHNKMEEYLNDIISEQKAAQLPPFGRHIVLSYPLEKGEETVVTIQEQISKLIETPWQMGHAFEAPWRKKAYRHILLHAPLGTRIPIRLRKVLVKLPRPWKVQNNPWYLL